MKKQYAVILPATMKHFEGWILDPARTEPLKMREKNISFYNILLLLKYILKSKKHAYFDLEYFEALLSEHVELLI